MSGARRVGRLLLALVLVLGSVLPASCAAPAEPTPTPAATPAATPAITEGTVSPAMILNQFYTRRDGFILSTPLESQQAFRNPGKGWVVTNTAPDRAPAAISGGGVPPPFVDTIYSNYFTWAMLEPAEGQYRWDILDTFVGTWSAEPWNLTVGLSIGVYFPTSISGTYQVPLWLVETPGMEGFLKSPFGEEKYEPAYYNPVFREKWEAFVRALGQRYAETPAWQVRLLQEAIAPVCIRRLPG